MFVKKHRSSLFLLFAMMTLLLAACSSTEETGKTENSEKPNESNEEATEGADREGWPDKFVYGILPAEDQDTLTNRYEPFEAYLEEKLDMPVELYQGTDFTAMIEAMRNGHIHASKYGSFAYILANERANAEAFVQGVKVKEEPYYHAVFITREETGIKSLEDLKGRTFAFVDPASTSGHLFPRAKLIDDLGLSNEEVDQYFGSVVFAGNHDAAYISVLTGDVEAAALSQSSYERIKEQYTDHPNYESVIEVARTEDIPRSPEAIRADLPDSFKQTVKEAFLGIKDEPTLQDFLVEHNYHDGYVEIQDDVYNVVRDTADALGLSPEDLLQ